MARCPTSAAAMSASSVVRRHQLFSVEVVCTYRMYSAISNEVETNVQIFGLKIITLQCNDAIAK